MGGRAANERGGGEPGSTAPWVWLERFTRGKGSSSKGVRGNTSHVNEETRWWWCVVGALGKPVQGGGVLLGRGRGGELRPRLPNPAADVPGMDDTGTCMYVCVARSAKLGQEASGLGDFPPLPPTAGFREATVPHPLFYIILILILDVLDSISKLADQARKAPALFHGALFLGDPRWRKRDVPRKPRLSARSDDRRKRVSALTHLASTRGARRALIYHLGPSPTLPACLALRLSRAWKSASGNRRGDGPRGAGREWLESDAGCPGACCG